MKTICSGCGEHLKGDPADIVISHGLCAPCVRRLYPDIADEILSGLEEGL